MYDDKWKIFYQFRRSKGITAVEATSPQVADFLCHLRNTRNLKGSTLVTYVAAISIILTMTNGEKQEKVPKLIALLRSYKLEDQKKKSKSPSRYLNVVLINKSNKGLSIFI